jgi:hypothetical protein
MRLQRHRVYILGFHTATWKHIVTRHETAAAIPLEGMYLKASLVVKYKNNRGCGLGFNYWLSLGKIYLKKYLIQQVTLVVR